MKTKLYFANRILFGFFILFLSSFSILNSKTEFLIGTIYDENKNTLSNVEIINLENNFVTISDKNGKFTVKGSKKNRLKFIYNGKPSFVEFVKKTSELKFYFDKKPKAVFKKTKKNVEPKYIESEYAEPKVDHTKYFTHRNEKLIIGRIRKSGVPLPGANIKVKGTKIIANSDFNGFYGIDAKIGDVLVVEFIGVSKIEATVTEKNMNFNMSNDSRLLEMVVKSSAIKKNKTKIVNAAPSVSIQSEGIAISKAPSTAGASEYATEDSYKEKKTKEPEILEVKSQKAGQLTAGEVNDFSKWNYWQDIEKTDLNQWQAYWITKPQNRYSVIITNKNGYPIANKELNLIDDKNKKIWSSRTDNTGRAELWDNPFKISEINKTQNFKITDNSDTVLIENPKEFRNGVNKIKTNQECSISNKINIAFMIDATGSMGDEISYLQAELKDVIEKTKKAIPNSDLKMGSVFYRDAGDDYLVKNFDFTENISDVMSFIQKQSADGGGDTPEAVIEGYESAIEKLSWDDDARAKLLFVLLDAPPHYNDENLVKLQNLAKKAAEKGIRIIPIAASGIDKSTEYLMRATALETNGTYLFITNDSGIGNDHIAPTTDSYKVEMLNELILRIIKQFTAITTCENLEKNYPTNTKIEEKIKDDNSIKWKYYPNPTSEKVTIELEETANQIELYDTTGKLVLYELKDSKNFEIDLTNLPNSIYYLKVSSKDTTLFGKIIKH